RKGCDAECEDGFLRRADCAASPGSAGEYGGFRPNPVRKIQVGNDRIRSADRTTSIVREREVLFAVASIESQVPPYAQTADESSQLQAGECTEIHSEERSPD